MCVPWLLTCSPTYARVQKPSFSAASHSSRCHTPETHVFGRGGDRGGFSRCVRLILRLRLIVHSVVWKCLIVG